MGFAAAAPIIAAGIGAASNASSGKGGKGGGGSSGGGSFQQTNFAPFQGPAIKRVFDVLEGGEGTDLLLGGTGRDSLLETPAAASEALSDGLDFVRDLLAGRDAGTRGLQNFESLLNDDLDDRPFASTIDDISDLRDAIEQRFNPLIDRAVSLSDRGLNPRFGNILEGVANEDPFSNPFVDRLVGDTSTDVSNAVKDQFISAGGLESSAAPQAIAREVARAAADIRGRFGESSRNRSLSAAQSGAQFDIADARAQLEALLGGGTLASQSTQGQLGAQSQINDLTKAEQDRRLNLIRGRERAAELQANVPIQGLGSVVPLAQAFTELPFLSAANFLELASAPLGSTRLGIDQNSGGGKGGPFSLIDPLANAALTGIGILDEGGVFDGGGGSSGSVSDGNTNDDFSLFNRPNFSPNFTPLTGANNPAIFT